MTKSELQDQKATTPKKDQRSTSQNRVLSKKNNQSNSQKALPKASIPKNDESYM